MATPERNDGPAVPSLLRELNERVVLEAVWEYGPVHRAEVSRITGLSKPTVSLSLQSLLSSGLVTETARRHGDGGRAASHFTAVKDAALVLAVDIGARFVRGRLTDLAGQSMTQTDIPLGDQSLGGVLHTVVAVRDRLLTDAHARPADVAIAVVGTPGIIDPLSGVVTEPGQIFALEGVALGELLTQRLGVEVVLENDVNLMALGEQSAGYGRGVDNFAVLAVGTGLGAGLVLNGELYRGSRGAAGEVHVIPYAEVSGGPRYEMDPAASGFEVMARSAATKLSSRLLREPFDAADVFAAAREGDAAALEAIELEAAAIARYLVALAAVIDVNLVVLAGGIGANADLTLEPLRAAVGEIVRFPPRIECTGLGRGAVLEGAAAVGLRQARNWLFEFRVVPHRG